VAVTLSSPIEIYHVSEERIATIFLIESNQQAESFNPEDGSIKFLRNVCEYLPKYMALYPRGQYSQCLLL
jgi:hypothetical protein